MELQVEVYKELRIQWGVQRGYDCNSNEEAVQIPRVFWV